MYVDINQSKAYADSRPSYTDELFKTIVDYCKKTNPNLNLAVDVGCGPGMSTIGFAKYFKKVIGVDVSETQIACAPEDIPNCEFKVGYSDKLPFIHPGSVDLFCCGEAFHWMPQEETFAEADRILRPGGTIAIFGYELPTSDIPEVQAIVHKFFMKLVPFNPKEAAQTSHGYKFLQMPYPDSIRNTKMQLLTKYTIQNYVDLIRSTWAARACREARPEQDILGDLAEELTEALEKFGSGKDFTLTWNLFLIMAHKPRN
ncbi:hypothetical protein RRG08_039318 [Elysia crispata]|uniref:Methyltransferase type 11 domain-containing protein n=1 Tax=Elysia crispata TaxID=231223 RepID=A0AAE1D342_9GAST|nr:hypothetical protein RRG08_039318 [Elysia crispata]